MRVLTDEYVIINRNGVYKQHALMEDAEGRLYVQLSNGEYAKLKYSQANGVHSSEKVPQLSKFDFTMAQVEHLSVRHKVSRTKDNQVCWQTSKLAVENV